MIPAPALPALLLIAQPPTAGSQAAPVQTTPPSATVPGLAEPERRPDLQSPASPAKAGAQLVSADESASRLQHTSTNWPPASAGEAERFALADPQNKSPTPPAIQPGAPAELTAPLTDPQQAPAGPEAMQTTPATPAPPSPDSAAAELADPLADPAASSTPVTSPVQVVGQPVRHAPGDPLEKVNRRFFRAHERFDRALFRPAALGYKRAVPKPVRSGLRNFFSNLGEPVVFLNYLLQLKPGKAAETLGRFAINSTLGLGGVLDVAKQPKVRLAHRSNSFGNTLALYGVKPGPYLFLPFVGPTTLRDLLGGQADGLVLPLAVGKPFDRLEYQIPKGVVTGLDRRAEADAELNALFASAVDPYATLRSVYLQNRQGEIDQLRGTRHHAAPPAPELGEPLADPAGTAPKPDEQPAPELSDPLTDPAASPR